MKIKYVLMVCMLSLVFALSGCGNSENKIGEANLPTEGPAATTEGQNSNPTEEAKTEESVEQKAIAAYQELLKAAPAIDPNQIELQEISMNYEKNLETYGEHYDTYAIHDINGDGVPEMIAVTTINFRWSVVDVYTYVDGAPVLLNNPLNATGHGTLDQNASVNGAYHTFVCNDHHIHSVWSGMTPMGEMEEIYAYAIEGKTLKQVDCAITGGENESLYADISKKNEFGEARPVKPSPTPTEPVAQMTVKVDYYHVPELYSKFLTEGDMKAYKAVVDAWLNYEPKAKVDKPSEQDALWGLIKECFFVIYGDFDEDRGFTYDQEYIYFPYVSKTKEEHDAIIKEFEDRVQFFFEGIGEDEEGVELERHIYINFNKTITYDYDVSESKNFTFKNSSGYTALMQGSGVCMSFARAYCFLVRQAAGLEAFCVSGLPGIEGIDSHQWSALKVGDKYYFADPTWDYTEDPRNYIYFCFGLDRREDNGYPEDLMNVCENGRFKMKDYVTIERSDME